MAPTGWYGLLKSYYVGEKGQRAQSTFDIEIETIISTYKLDIHSSVHSANTDLQQNPNPQAFLPVFQ